MPKHKTANEYISPKTSLISRPLFFLNYHSHHQANSHHHTEFTHARHCQVNSQLHLILQDTKATQTPCLCTVFAHQPRKTTPRHPPCLTQHTHHPSTRTRPHTPSTRRRHQSPSARLAQKSRMSCRPLASTLLHDMTASTAARPSHSTHQPSRSRESNPAG